MMGEAGVYLCLAILVLLSDCGNSSPVDGRSTCETTGTVLDGQSANVTCHFYKPHKKFMIYQLLPPSEEDGKTENEIVTVCTYEQNGPKCDLLEGHTVTTNAARDQAVLHMASARQKSSGKYFCKTLPASEDDADNCTLVVQGNIPRDDGLVTCKTNASVSAGEKCLLTCEFKKTVGSTGIMLVKESGHGSSSEEEIMVCDRASNCSIKKEGYEMAEKTTTHVAVSIPHLKTDYTGNYKCKSATLKGVSHGCQLQMQVSADRTSDESGSSPYVVITLATLVAVLLVMFFIFFILVYRRRRVLRRSYTQAATSQI